MGQTCSHMTGRGREVSRKSKEKQDAGVAQSVRKTWVEKSYKEEKERLWGSES